jgi:hypothetical protein
MVGGLRSPDGISRNDKTDFKNAGRSKGDPIGSRQERNGVRGNNRSPQRNGHRGNNHYGHGYSTHSDHL